MRRRTFLKATGASLAAVALGSAAGCADSPADQTATLLPSARPLPPAFRVPLPIPAVKKPTRTRDGVTHYEIVQRIADAEIIPGLRTPIMGYDGTFPGPTIRARRGERVVVRQRNQLPVPTVVHLHGGNTAAVDDGYPVDLVLPTTGAERFEHPMQGGHDSMQAMDASGDWSHGQRDYHYANDQRAATLWYHDHRMDFTGAQVWRGLAGFYLIDDEVEDKLSLPHDDREIPLMITDRSFGADGELIYPSADPDLVSKPGPTEKYSSGVLGDAILVNGAPWPELEVEAARYRFRVLNASNARRYRLTLDPPPPGAMFTQIGSDGGLLGKPVEQQNLTMAPAERFDVVVDFSGYRPGTTIVVRNGLGSDRTAEVMRFVVGRKATDDSHVAATLAPIEPLNTSGAVRREWRFTRKRMDGGMTMWAINGKFFDPRRMDARIELGRTEIWRFSTDLHHPVHVHLSPFQVLGRNGGSPGDFDAGWKDTIDLLPTEYADVAIRFESHRGHYLLHCHNLEHEDMGMMSAFEVA